MSFGFLGVLKRRPVARRPAPPEERLHAVAGRSLPLRIVENARAKRLTLRIETGGQSLRITTPPGLPRREVDLFLDRHQGWLEQRLARVPDQPKIRPGVRIPIRGVPHVIAHDPARRGAAVASVVDGVPTLTVHGDLRFIGRRTADHLKRLAKAEIETLVATHAATVGRRATRISFKDTSSRWGSCSSAGALSFSWRIMMAPPEVIDYLVAHEAAHLREMNHGPRFWALCKRLCPDTERCRAWLKRNGNALQAIDFGPEAA